MHDRQYTIMNQTLESFGTQMAKPIRVIAQEVMNEVVNKGQFSCFTPMVYDLDPRKAQAQGIHATPNSDAYKKAVTI